MGGSTSRLSSSGGGGPSQNISNDDASSSGSRAGGSDGDRFRRRTSSSSSVSDRDAMLSDRCQHARQFLPRHSCFTLVDGKPIGSFSASSPMVDSGSTFSFMRSSNWGHLRDALVSYCDGTIAPVGADSGSDGSGSDSLHKRGRKEPPGSEAGDEKRHRAATNFQKTRQSA